MKCDSKAARKRVAMVLAGAGLIGAAGFARAAQIGDVFVIAMENHNWTQPFSQFTGTQQQIYQNTNAPFINALVSGGAGATLTINGTPTNIAAQAAYATHYNNVSSPGNLHVHPSEPSYIWAEAGTNFGVTNDNQPYGAGGTNQNTNQHLTSLLNARGVSWKSYQEDIDLVPTAGTVNNPTGSTVTSTVAAQSQWTSPIRNFSGTNNPAYSNAYNGSHRYDYAVKHNPMAFFSDTNGGNDITAANPARLNYAPLQQLQTDLTNGTVARYNWITPDQFNDMHTALSGGYTPLGGGASLTGEAAKLRQGDDFLKQIIPMIMASAAYQNNGTIILWWDETESTGAGGENADDANHTIPEIIISPLAHANVAGVPYASGIAYTHSSDLLTMQEIFQAGTSLTANGALGDAINATNLADLFQSGVIPTSIPEPASSFALLGLTTFAFRRTRRA